MKVRLSKQGLRRLSDKFSELFGSLEKARLPLSVITYIGTGAHAQFFNGRDTTSRLDLKAAMGPK